METKKTSPIPISRLFLWISTIIVFCLGIFSFLKALRSSKKIMLNESIGPDIFTAISNKLVDDYNFVRFSNDNTIKNVQTIQFTNDVALESKEPCEMTFAVNTSNDNCEVDYLMKLTGDMGTNNTVQFGIPENDPWTIGLDSSGNEGAPRP